MDKIVEYLKGKYESIAIIVYGSYADGTNNANSDFDALVIASSMKYFTIFRLSMESNLTHLFIPKTIFNIMFRMQISCKSVMVLLCGIQTILVRILNHRLSDL